jgi:hypothetical protein
MDEKSLRPDEKGRVTLGELARGVSSFRVTQSPDGTIHLTPFAEVPAAEAWLFKNKDALQSVRRGIEQAERGELQVLGSFASFADDEA